MALVSRCPRCEQPVTIPAGIDAVTQVCCPACQAEYALYEAMAGASTVPDWLAGPPPLAFPSPPEPAEPAASTHPDTIAPVPTSVELTAPEPSPDSTPEPADPIQLPPGVDAAAETPPSATAPMAASEEVADITPYLPPEEPFDEEDSDAEEDDAVDPALFGGNPRLSPAYAADSQPTPPPDASSPGTADAWPSVVSLPRERIAARIQGRSSGGLRNMIGLILFSGLGLFLPYWGLSVISPSFNFLGITWLPGVRHPVQSSTNSVIEHPGPAPSRPVAESDGKWPGFAPTDDSKRPAAPKKK